MNFAWFILPAYFFAQFLIAFFFNWKIYWVSRENFKKAATFGFAAELLFALSMIIAAVVGASSLESIGEQIGYIFASAGLMALGTATATLLNGKINNVRNSKRTTLTLEEKVEKLEKDILKLKKANGKK